jgi:hypothetical protein
VRLQLERLAAGVHPAVTDLVVRPPQPPPPPQLAAAAEEVPAPAPVVEGAPAPPVRRVLWPWLVGAGLALVAVGLAVLWW